MRLLALVLPRLGIQLARRSDPSLNSRPVVLVTGTGESALVALPSVEATAGGIETGMTVSQARERVPSVVAIVDNAGECLDALDDLASILRSYATTNVAIVSRDAIIVSLEGMETRFDGEVGAANALARFARTWSGFDVRAGVAATREGALHAARSARRFPVVCAESSGTEPHPVAPDGLGAHARWETAQPASAVESRLARSLTTLETVMEERPASYRSVIVELTRGRATDRWNLRAPRPLHTAAEVFELIRSRISANAMEGATAFDVRLERAGPDVRVDPWRRPVATMHTLAGPAVPVQPRLRLAS